MQPGVAKEFFFPGTLEQWIDQQKLIPKPAIARSHCIVDGGDLDLGRVAVLKGKVIAFEIETSWGQMVVAPSERRAHLRRSS